MRFSQITCSILLFVVLLFSFSTDAINTASAYPNDNPKEKTKYEMIPSDYPILASLRYERMRIAELGYYLYKGNYSVNGLVDLHLRMIVDFKEGIRNQEVKIDKSSGFRELDEALRDVFSRLVSMFLPGDYDLVAFAVDQLSMDIFIDNQYIRLEYVVTAHDPFCAFAFYNSFVEVFKDFCGRYMDSASQMICHHIEIFNEAFSSQFRLEMEIPRSEFDQVAIELYESFYSE